MLLPHPPTYTPNDRDDIPFPRIKVSGLMTRPKPNGKVRVILNQSRAKPCCVNDGINKDNFPTRMGSIKIFLIMLHSSGIGAEFTNCDWSAAYKHIRVRKEDVQLYDRFTYLLIFLQTNTTPRPGVPYPYKWTWS